MKMYKNALILAIILALLSGLYMWTKNTQENAIDNTPDISSEKVMLIPADKDIFSRIERSGAGGSITLEKKDADFVLISPAGKEGDSNKISDFTDTLSLLTSTKIIEKEPKDYSLYGLDKPQASINVKMNDGSSVTLQIGIKSYSNENYYVKKDGDSAVYTIYSYQAESLLQDVFKDEKTQE